MGTLRRRVMIVPLLVMLASGAHAEETAARGTTGADAGASLASGYCTNVSDRVADARLAWQARQMTEMSSQLDAKIGQLDEKIRELKSWLARRETFTERASATLVKIYTAMRPEAASKQLMNLDEATAAAIVMKLKPRDASAILNDMDPKKAARLTAVISGASQSHSSSGGS